MFHANTLSLRSVDTILVHVLSEGDTSLCNQMCRAAQFDIHRSVFIYQFVNTNIIIKTHSVDSINRTDKLYTYVIHGYAPETASRPNIKNFKYVIYKEIHT